MQQIACARTECGQITYLIDHEMTLDSGWWKGTEPSGAPFYVCPGHPSAYFIVPVPSAVISKQEMPVEHDHEPASPSPSVDASAADDSEPGPSGG